MEAEKSHNLQLATWRLKGGEGVAPAQEPGELLIKVLAQEKEKTDITVMWDTEAEEN